MVQIYKTIIAVGLCFLLAVGSLYAADPKAKRVRIIDAGSLYTGTNVETALQEIGDGTTGGWTSDGATTSTPLDVEVAGDMTLTTIQTGSLYVGGNLGVGTTDPTVKLDVWGDIGLQIDGAGTTKKIIGRTGSTEITFIDMGNSSARDMEFGSQDDMTFGTDTDANSATSAFKFETDGGTELMRIASNGNVGIGTTAPGEKLDVVGDVSLGTGSGTPSITFRGSGDNDTIVKFATNVLGTSARWRADNGTLAAPGFAFNDDINTGIYGDNNDLISIVTGGVQQLTVNTTGNVGIGTTAPALLLDLAHATGQDLRLSYGSSTTLTTDLIIDSAGEMTITSPTDKTPVFSPVVFDELPPIPITASKLGSTAPTLATFRGNIEQYTFDNTNDYIIGATEIVHWYKEGTAIHPHVHWATNGVDADNTGVKWQLEYSIANMDSTGVGETFPSTTITISTETPIPANTPDRTHMYTDFTDISGTNRKTDDLITIRFERIAVGVGTTNPAADPFGLSIGFHAEKDTLGSRTETTK